MAMLAEDLKLATHLEQRLARLVQQDKRKIQRIDAEMEQWGASIPVPVRASQPFIQRQQYYTGDA